MLPIVEACSYKEYNWIEGLKTKSTCMFQHLSNWDGVDIYIYVPLILKLLLSTKKNLPLMMVSLY